MKEIEDGIKELSNMDSDIRFENMWHLFYDARKVYSVDEWIDPAPPLHPSISVQEKSGAALRPHRLGL